MIITTVTTDGGAILPLGRQMEHGVRQVWFDLNYLIENFGEGTAVLVHQRNKDLAPYVVTATQTNNRLEWTMDDTDTAYEGFGKAEIRWTVNGDLAKTVIYKTSVQRSLTAQTEVPDPLESWYDKMLEQIGDSQGYAEQAAQSAQEASGYAQSAESAASTAATDAANAVRQEVHDDAVTASQSAQDAEAAKQAVLSASITITPVTTDGNLTFSASLS